MNKVILSEDGSHTVLSDKFGVTYHSKHGSIQETRTVFLDAGLSYQLQKGIRDISILEMGFGTGLNAIMTYRFVKHKNVILKYHTVEAYPLEMDVVKQLNYPEVLNLSEDELRSFHQFHLKESGIFGNFDFRKYTSKIQELDFESNAYDIIYYDAFAPSAQEELWTQDIMSKLYNACKNDGVLVTYCAKGSFKRALKGAGFIVEGLPGPIGKREMTRAIKIIA